MKGASFKDEDGSDKPYYMGCYGIGVGRTMAAIVEKFHDDKGIIWPENIAPFKVHLISLKGAESQANQLYEDLLKAGVEVLYDDREASAGVKFADADLIGMPYRVLLSPKTIDQGSVEFKKRSDEKAELVKLESLIEKLKM